MKNVDNGLMIEGESEEQKEKRLQSEAHVRKLAETVGLRPLGKDDYAMMSMHLGDGTTYDIFGLILKAVNYIAETLDKVK